MGATVERRLVCHHRFQLGHTCEEAYATDSGDGRRRALTLRRLGYEVLVLGVGLCPHPRGPRFGHIKITELIIEPGTNKDTHGLPAVKLAPWPGKVRR